MQKTDARTGARVASAVAQGLVRTVDRSGAGVANAVA